MKIAEFMGPDVPFWGLLLGLATIVGYVLVPLQQQLPVHWGFDGTADLFMVAWLALLMPLAIFGVTLIVFAAIKTWRPADFEAGWYINQAAITIIGSVMLGLLVALILAGRGVEPDMPRWAAVLTAVLLFVLGNALPKSKPNVLAGIRLPSTLRDPANWQVTHFWAGVAMMSTAPVLLLAAVLGVPSNWLIAILCVAVLLPVGIAIAVSLRHARGKGLGE